MNDEPNELKDIVAQLHRLHIEERELLVRLGQLSVADSSPISTQPSREFKIGDLVRIINPKPFQKKKGKIVKIGTNRITVQPNNGSKIVRAPSNLIHID
jgi:transcription antitermination factor NusG